MSGEILPFKPKKEYSDAALAVKQAIKNELIGHAVQGHQETVAVVRRRYMALGISDDLINAALHDAGFTPIIEPPEIS